MYPNKELESSGVVYAALEDVLVSRDIISLHCSLNEDTHYMINEKTIATMRTGVALINTSRGGLINTADIIEALKNKRVAYLGIDVYEQEEKLFFRDLSGSIIDDDVIQRLISFPIVFTAHQVFFTQEALSEIAQITLKSIHDLASGQNP